MTRVLIVGGGVAGPVTAMALQRAGIDAALYEAHAPSTEEVGSYLTVATNGIDALRAIDADAPVLAAGFPTPTNMLWSGSGGRLGAVSNGGVLPDGTTAHTIKRARLYRVLHQQAAARGLRIEYGRRLVDAQATPDGVTARFADGTTAAGDLLVGADGVHSATRAIIDPAAPGPRYVGLVNFGGYTHQAAPGSAEPGVWHMIFGRQAGHLPVRRPADHRPRPAGGCDLQHGDLPLDPRPSAPVPGAGGRAHPRRAARGAVRRWAEPGPAPRSRPGADQAGAVCHVLPRVAGALAVLLARRSGRAA
jgi:2-polyprenyl-6-methoxyphenol hydroxylase-like FAD-dependent oxidoreductase